MTIGARISCFAALATGPLAACGAAPDQDTACYGNTETIEGTEACVTLIHEQGRKGFGAFVHPDTVSRQGAARAVLGLAQTHCAQAFGLRADPNLTVQKGGWAVPGAWEITGNCI